MLINTAQSWLELMQGIRGGMSEREMAGWLGVSQATVHRWVTEPRTPHEKTIEKVAERIGVSPVVLREVARRPSGEATPFRLPAEANQLDNRQRDLVREMISVLLDAGRPAKVTR